MTKSDVVRELIDLEDSLSDILDMWSDASLYEPLVTYKRDNNSMTMTFPDENDICFCETCEEAWLKGEDSRCECEKGE